MAAGRRQLSRASRSSLERTACDKCRSQKLRCVRDEPADKDSLPACKRCVDTGLVCVTGPPKPLGRHSVRQKHVSRDALLVVSTRSGDDAGIRDSGLMDIQVPHAGSSGTRPPETNNTSPSSSSSLVVDLLETVLDETGRSGKTCDDTSAHPGSDTIDVRSCRLNLSLSQQAMALETATKSDKNFRTGLGLLNANLVLGTSEQRLQTPQTSHINMVLDSISEFLGILRWCSENSFSLRSSGTDSGNQLHQTSPERTEAYGPSQKAEPWIFHAFMPQDSQATSESPAAPAFPKRRTNQAYSTSTVLSLASCYLHVIAIHDMLLQKMHLELREMSAPSLENPQIIEGRKLDGFVAHNSGLQAKILIQGMEHQLQLIETGLGLPSQYRVRPRFFQLPEQSEGQEPHENEGIFDSFDAKALLESAMRLDDHAAARRIWSLRQNLDEILELAETLLGSDERSA